MFEKIYKMLGSQWNNFIKELRSQTTLDEPNLILLKQFVQVLR